MTEVVYSVPSYAVMEALAQQLGWWIPDEKGGGKIQTNGLIKGGGNYQLNHVGKVYIPTGNMIDGPLGPYPETEALPGEWGRLRLNGPSNFLSLIPSEAPITQYHLIPAQGETPAFWSSDGVTPAPDYVATIGMIA